MNQQFSTDKLMEFLLKNYYTKEDNAKFVTIMTSYFLELRNDFCNRYPESPEYRDLKLLPIPWVANDGNCITLFITPSEDI